MHIEGAERLNESMSERERCRNLSERWRGGGLREGGRDRGREKQRASG